MKILHVATGLQKASGVTTFVEGAVQALTSLGHEVVVETLQTCPSPKREQLAGCDVLHIHGMWSPWLHKWVRLARKVEIPVVWSTHGMTAPWSLKHKWWKKCFYWLLVQKPDLKRAALIHSTVEQEREWNAALGFERHIVAPLGTHLPKEKTKSSDVQLHLESTPKTLLFVGRIYPVKALDRLIEAFAKANVDGWKLRIVGPDQAGHMAELMKHCESLGLTYTDREGKSHAPSRTLDTNANRTRVEFAGPRFDDELETEYDSCDILALVSHTENFGATVVDAMAHAKPVIVGANTPWKEVADIEAGWCSDNDVAALASTLWNALSTPTPILREMGRRGHALVETKYTWKAVAKALEVAYLSVCRGCDKGRCAVCAELYDTCSP